MPSCRKGDKVVQFMTVGASFECEETHAKAKGIK